MEFDFLKIDMMNLSYIPTYESNQKIKKLIERHIRLLNLSDKFQKIYTTIFFMNLFLTATILCFTILQLSTADDLSTILIYISFLGMFAGQSFLLCLYGQKLIDSSSSVAEGIYNCNWESFEDNNYKKQIIPIMAQSQKGKCFTAMSFAELSLSSFNTVSFKLLNKLK